MPVANAEIAELFERYAALLEIDGANAFRVRAYRNAARTIENLPQSAAGMVEEGADLSELPGIGEDLGAKIRAIVETGSFEELDALEGQLPEGLAALSDLPGLGPKRVAALHRELDVDDLDDLRAAAEAGRVRELDGFGATTERKILAAIERRAGQEKRFRLATAEQFAEPLLEHLRGVEGVAKAEIAGSYRRRKETVGDLDVLVVARAGSPVMDRFTGYDAVEEVVSKGETRSSVRLRNGLQVDLRVMDDAAYGAALHYFTGSKAHNIRTRRIAGDKNWKLNEYGLFEGDERVAGEDEAEVYAALGLRWMTPELREDRGEIEAAQKGELPELVTLDAIEGDLHSHTKWSDGRDDAATMAAAAKERGYAYLAVTDHSRNSRVANGLDPDRLARQIDEIDRLNEELDGLRLLKGSEVDILEDGSLDLPDDILSRLDLRVCSLHDKLDLPQEKQTARVLRAMENRWFNIFAHPTARLIEKREPAALDMEAVLAAARERGCHLEINASPQRLDLNDVHARMAKEMGVKLAISTDAHGTAGLAAMRFGIDQARRAWLGPEDVLNTRPWSELKTLLDRS
jgi:DNA polymerase (family 10)